jgi:hypothetical protein
MEFLDANDCWQWKNRGQSGLILIHVDHMKENF